MVKTGLFWIQQTDSVASAPQRVAYTRPRSATVSPLASARGFAPQGKTGPAGSGRFNNEIVNR